MASLLWIKSRLRKAEEHFLVGAGVFTGTLKHLPQSDQNKLMIEAIGTEAVTTSEIEGRYLNRAKRAILDSQAQLGLGNGLAADCASRRKECRK